MGRLAPSLTRASVMALAAYALIGGALTLAGWFAGAPRLTDWTGSGISMFPNTAFSAMCAGAAIILALQRRRWTSRVSGLLGLLVLLLGGATLLQHLSGVNLGIDAMLVKAEWGSRAATAAGRMGPPASTSFVLIGLALLLINSEWSRARRVVPALAITVITIAVLALLGYASSANPLFAIARYTGIAMQTATMLLALSLGVLGSVPEYEPVRMLQRDSAAGMLMRRSLPFIIALPLLLSWLRVRGQELGWYDTAMGTALLTLSLIVIFCGLLWWWVGAVATHEDALRERERVQRLLARVGELGARQPEIDELIGAICQGVAVELGVSRCGYTLVDQSAGTLTVTRDYCGPLRSLAGVYPFSPYGIVNEDSIAGQVTVNEDMASHPRSAPDFEKLWAPLDLRACVSVPLYRDGRWAANFWVCHHEPRRWTSAEVDLVKIIADRVWLVVERQKAEEALRQSEALLSSVLRQVPVGLGVMNLEGQWIISNAMMQTLMSEAIPSTLPERVGRWCGYEADGQPVPPEDWPGQRALRGEIVSPGLEMVYTDDDGRERWMRVSAAPLRDEAGVIVGATAVVQDIDEIRAAQDKIAEQARAVESANVRLQGIIFSAMDAVITIDSRQRIMLFNPAAEIMFGVKAGEIEGQSIERLIPIRFRSSHAHSVETFGRTGVSNRQMGALGAVSGLRASGEEFPIEASISQVKIDGEKLFTVILRDITERKRADEERAALLERERTARAEAEHASRVKDEFLATLSHELRTPLNAILGWSRLIEQNRGNPATVSEGIQVITRNAKVQADLIADLLDMSRIVSGKLRLDIEGVDLSEVVRAALDAVRHSAEAKKIHLQADLRPIALPVRGDAGRLQQVVWNVLSNAIKFTPKDGRVEVSLAATDSHAEVTVRDNGMGIRPEFLPYLFERFRQADTSISRYFGGLGLGLAIVRHLVELHGGAVRAESPGAGQGSTFVIQIPLAPAPQPTDVSERPGGRPLDKPEAPGAAGIDLVGVKILAVDDQADARSLIDRVFQQCRAEVLVASSSDEALQALDTYEPHVVLCDLGMPGKDGYEFLREMRSRGCMAPALAVTAFARPEDRLRAARAGFQGHIAKPFEPADLVAAVASFARPAQTSPHATEG